MTSTLAHRSADDTVISVYGHNVLSHQQTELTTIIISSLAASNDWSYFYRHTTILRFAPQVRMSNRSHHHLAIFISSIILRLTQNPPLIESFMLLPKKKEQDGQAIYTFSKSRSRNNWPIVVACCLLSCRDNSTRNCCPSRPTMTLDQGQGHRNEHEHIWWW